MKLDFLIPASPTASFCSQIAFFKHCLNYLGGFYAEARVVAVFGDHTQESLPLEWKPYFDDIEVEWAHPPGAENPSYRAQHDRRFEIIRKNADLAFLCDADIAILRPFDDLIADLCVEPALAGVIAHFHFPWGDRERLPDVDWPDLARDVIGKPLERNFRYTLLPKDAPKNAPFYLNYGVLAGTPEMLTEFYNRDLELRDRIAQFVGDYWAPQISIALTCADLNLPTKALPMRFNFPNDDQANALYPDELSEIVFFHYLRLARYRRDQIFLKEGNFRAFLSLSLHGADDVFQAFVKRVTKNKYPFGGLQKPINTSSL